MLDMTLYVDEQSSYITDLNINENGEMVITYADETVRVEKYSEHNFNYYRGKMVKQAMDYSDGAIKDMGISFLKTQGLRIISTIGGLVGLYFLYNFDVHIIMKIIITLLVLFGEAAMLYFTQLYLVLLEDDSIEAFAYQEYLKHLDNFIVYDTKTGEEHYILPIEDIERQKMDPTFVSNINKNIDELVKMGSLKKNIRIDYTKIDPHKKK